jgi:transcription elongation factor/antiterminator RfaH
LLDIYSQLIEATTRWDNLMRDWYAVYSNRNKEQQAQFHLSLRGVECYFPRLHIPSSRPSRSRIVPLFPNYLFVRVNIAMESHLVIWTPGVKRIVSFSDQPIPIDDSVVRFLQAQANDKGIIQARSRLQPGEEVEISGGPFDGLMGIIQSPPDNRGRVKVLLTLLSRQVSVKFGVEFIKGSSAAWTVDGAIIGSARTSAEE